MCSFLESADRLTGKFIIRIKLRNPRDIRGNAQSKTSGV